MQDTIRTFFETIAVAVALVLASLDFSGAQAQAIMGVARPGSMPQVVYPSLSSQRNQASVARGRDGHFVFDASVNGTAMPMMFDTGASVVALRAEDAEAAGIGSAGLRYSAVVSTANGPSAVAPVMIATLTVGGITRHNVRGIVSKPGAQSVSLLGQSFMAQLAGYRLDGDQLILMGGE